MQNATKVIASLEKLLSSEQQLTPAWRQALVNREDELFVVCEAGEQWDEMEEEVARLCMVVKEMGVGMIIKKAKPNEKKKIVSFIDNNFTREGFGFVTSSQIETEINRGVVWIAVLDNKIIGVRIGLNKVYNLCVKKEFRGCGIGKDLINIERPDRIRVKSDPVGNLSKKQKTNFKSPEEFYKKLGYKFVGKDYGRNFWQRGSDKAHFHQVGKKKHIKIYEDKDPEQKRMEF